jgi:hypothetical protein
MNNHVNKNYMILPKGIQLNILLACLIYYIAFGLPGKVANNAHASQNKSRPGLFFPRLLFL